jgi:hypothetical protein
MTDGDDRYAGLAAQLLRAQPAQAEVAQADGRRDRVVAAMALAITGKVRRRRTVLTTGVMLAAAAAAAILLMIKAGSDHKQTGGSGETILLVEENTGAGNTLVRNAVHKPLVDGAHLVEGDSIEAQQDGSATLGFAGGTRVTVSEAGRLHVDELTATRRFSLRAGHLQAHVAKLGRGERFLVDTPDAEVEVRGTVFGVAVDGPESCRGVASRSTISVSEGAVWVRSNTTQVLLHPGESWTSPCPDTPPPAETEPPATNRESTTTVRRHAARTPARHLSAATPPSTQVQSPTGAPSVTPPATETRAPVRHESSLAEQNNLFSAAVTAEHQGDHRAALGKLDELIARFPNGPLRESARAEKQRILSAQPQR